MLVHTVLFWLDRNLSEADRAAFVADLEALRGIPSVRFVQVGQPSATNRPVVDRTYDVGVAVHFDDLKGHDEYQVHPLHTGFLQRNSSKWVRVLIYDFE
ncbi:MAG: Dabb family protein [Steroidobacteraceae bacterium]|jgi:hypothetical protein|nr:Dabb family protein [Steroidobacteraceae bacterium]